MSTQSYRAMQATGNGRLELVERPLQDPQPGHVRLRVEACGVCHTDAAVVAGPFPGIVYPRVPGHEVVGRIDALGEGVTRWSLGQRVGIGFLGGHCGDCAPCRRGDFVNCPNQPSSGMSYDGGYAEAMIANQNGLVAVPDDLDAVDAAPLLCAGVTTFNALRRSSALAGQLVAIQGVGGLDHLGIQFARNMGFRVAAIARGTDKKALALKLGAHHYIDSEAEDAAAALRALGGASVILGTASNSPSMSPLVGGLAPRGQLLVVGGGEDPLTVHVLALVFGEKAIAGSITGSPIETEDTLDFSVLQNIRPMIETVPLEEAQSGYDRMMRNEARFRIVLVMDGSR